MGTCEGVCIGSKAMGTRLSNKHNIQISSSNIFFLEEENYLSTYVCTESPKSTLSVY